MFKNILMPISSEFFNRQLLERAVFLSEKFNSKITLIYIIEEKTLEQIDKRQDTYRTYHDRTATKKGIIRNHQRTADDIIFEDSKNKFKQKSFPFKEKIAEGQFSSVIKNEIKNKKYDLILMGFEKSCNLNYRILDELDIDMPIWAVSDIQGNESILAVCSNLAPNQKVPDISIQLSQQLGWQLHMLYVVDVEDAVEVDEKLGRSNRKPENVLMEHGNMFVEKMKKQGIKVKIVKGSLEKEMIKTADVLKTKLIIVGRQQKKKGLLGIPMKKIKKRMAKKCKHSILFVN